MTQGDKIRQMDNKELAKEIFRWHDILFGNEFRFAEDIERYLNKSVEDDDGVDCNVRLLTPTQKELVADEELEIVLSPNDYMIYLYSNILDAFYPTEFNSVRDNTIKDFIKSGEHLKGHWCFGLDLEEI